MANTKSDKENQNQPSPPTNLRNQILTRIFSWFLFMYQYYSHKPKPLFIASTIFRFYSTSPYFQTYTLSFASLLDFEQYTYRLLFAVPVR